MTEKIKCAEAQMLIRKPVSVVFEAFIDPAITKNFWFTNGSGRLETGKTITWEWEMYNVSTNVFIKEIVADSKIRIDWGEPATSVDFDFKALSDGTTYVIIKNYGFNKTGDELLEVIKDSTGGFTTVLDGLKAFLEYGINLNLIRDKFPKEVMEHGNLK
ncbi:MAG TPA: SRPBCC family protein [Ferruginibacter sp.]|nr:SRPBCC family protein [Ferruginibacter sp.]